MASIVIYNVNNTRVLDYKPTANTPDFEGRPDVLINASNANALFESGVPVKYWKVVNGNVYEMDANEKANIDGFDTAQRIYEQKAAAKSLQDNIDNIGRIIRATTKLNIDENNVVFQWLQDFKTAVSLSTTLADLKTRVGALPNTPTRTYAQAKTAIENLVDSE